MIDTNKLSPKTLNARSTMGAKDLRLLDQQVKYILDQIEGGTMSITEALNKTYTGIFSGGQFAWIKFLTLKDIIKR